MENKAESTRICKQCLLRDMAGEAQYGLQKYIDAIKPKERTSEEQYEQRLEICKQCSMLLEGTCQACGCYVELRAAVEHSRCPKKKW